MRNQWYADHRDVVKWGVLFQLAATHGLRSILQVAYLPKIDDEAVVISSELGKTNVDPRVLNHFRNVNRISEISGECCPRIKVFAKPFTACSRPDYTLEAAKAIHDISPRPAAVLLDPDTGLAEKPASSKHVLSSEVSELWSALQSGDWLVLYQHAARKVGWLEARRASFCNAIGDAPVITFRSPNGARDVVFFAASRNVSI